MASKRSLKFGSMPAEEDKHKTEEVTCTSLIKHLYKIIVSPYSGIFNLSNYDDNHIFEFLDEFLRIREFSEQAVSFSNYNKNENYIVSFPRRSERMRNFVFFVLEGVAPGESPHQHYSNLEKLKKDIEAAEEYLEELKSDSQLSDDKIAGLNAFLGSQKLKQRFGKSPTNELIKALEKKHDFLKTKFVVIEERNKVYFKDSHRTTNSSFSGFFVSELNDESSANGSFDSPYIKSTIESGVRHMKQWYESNTGTDPINFYCNKLISLIDDLEIISSNDPFITSIRSLLDHLKAKRIPEESKEEAIAISVFSLLLRFIYGSQQDNVFKQYGPDNLSTLLSDKLINPFLINAKRKTKGKSFGVTRQVSGSYDNELETYIGDSKRPPIKKLDLIFTTAESFTLNTKTLLANALKQKIDIRLLCLPPHDTPLNEVQLAEEVGDNNNRSSIQKGLSQTIKHLTEAYRSASKGAKSIGTMEVRSAGTLFRSTLVLVRHVDEVYDWGWSTITLPPCKSNNAAALYLDYSDNNRSALSDAKKHFDTVWDLHSSNSIVLNSETFTIFKDKEDDDIGTILSLNLDHRSRWDVLLNKAIQDTISRRNNIKDKTKVLVEVSARHPLSGDNEDEPCPEFKSRLDHAYELYKKLYSEGMAVEIYIPGSKHMVVPEGELPEVATLEEHTISLSDAGKRYITVTKGVPDDIVHGDDWNSECAYKGSTGVYNSGEECFVAATKYKDKNLGFNRLISITTPTQAMRKSLLYISNGVLAEIITVPYFSDSVDDDRNIVPSYEEIIGEVYESIPKVLMGDYGYGEDSEAAKMTHYERDLYYATSVIEENKGSQSKPRVKYYREIKEKLLKH